MNEELYEKYCKLFEKKAINNNLVFFESHNGTDLGGNLFYLIKEIANNTLFSKYQMIISCSEDSKEMIDTLLDNYSIKRITTVVRETEEYFAALATAKYLFTDVGFYHLFRKKQGQVCINTWHGTPLKTLGYTYYQDAYVVPNQKRGFLLSDFFICPNRYTWEKMKQSYQLDQDYKGKVLLSGYPRNAVFFDDERKTLMRKKLGSEEKKIIAYLPTWRGKVTDVYGGQQIELLQEVLKQLDDSLPDNIEIWVKIHRLNGEKLDFNSFNHIIPFPQGYETYDVLNVVDILITDYSSVMFDYIATRNKIILFCYDKLEYTQKRKCYFSMNELPFPIVEEVNELKKEIMSGKEYNDTVVDHFCQYDSKNTPETVLKRILLNEKCCEEIEIEKEKSDSKILMFTGPLDEGDDTDYLFNYLNKHDEDTFYISYMNHLLNKKPYKLLQLKKYNLVPLYMYKKKYSYATKEEAEADRQIRRMLKEGKTIPNKIWSIQEQKYKREIERFTYNIHFFKYIRFSGLDLESLKMFRVFSGKKELFIHDNIVSKAEKDTEFLTHLNRAISVADEVHYVSEDVFNRAREILIIAPHKEIIEFY